MQTIRLSNNSSCTLRPNHLVRLVTSSTTLSKELYCKENSIVKDDYLLDTNMIFVLTIPYVDHFLVFNLKNTIRESANERIYK